MLSRHLFTDHVRSTRVSTFTTPIPKDAGRLCFHGVGGILPNPVNGPVSGPFGGGGGYPLIPSLVRSKVLSQVLPGGPLPGYGIP